MRNFLLIGILAGGLWTIDTLAFEGRNTEAFWNEAQSVGRQARYRLIAQLSFVKF